MRSPGMILVVSILLALGMSGCSSESDEKLRAFEGVDALPLYSVQEVDRIYETIGNVPLSELGDPLRDIVRQRIECYAETPIAEMRLKDCRKAYNLAVVRTAREMIKAKPMMGEAVLCFQDCPIFNAICRGNIPAPDEEQCVTQEVKCLEQCLDQYWRGTGLDWDSEGRGKR